VLAGRLCEQAGPGYCSIFGDECLCGSRSDLYGKREGEKQACVAALPVVDAEGSARLFSIASEYERATGVCEAAGSAAATSACGGGVQRAGSWCADCGDDSDPE
jgi:hypothetical protein